jgi:hypothetical protein
MGDLARAAIDDGGERDDHEMPKRDKVAGVAAPTEDEAVREVTRSKGFALALAFEVSKPKGRSRGLQLCDTTRVLSAAKHDQLREDLSGLVGARREAEVEATNVRL